MKQFNFTEARNNFAHILEIAKQEGVVCIAKRDGEAFHVTLVKPKKSPLDVEGVNLGLSRDDVTNLVNEGRERAYTW